MASVSDGQYVTMSIASLGESTLPRPSGKRFVVKQTNNVSDIIGAKSAPKYKQYFDKPQPLQSDVAGSTSKALSWTRNTRDNSLYIDDIEGTRHQVKDRMMRTTRHVNPLEPNYPVPTFVPAENPTTKFIKDPQYHEDIEGSTVKPKKQFKTRDIMNIDDIDGSKSGWKPRHRCVRMESNPRDNMAIQDISAPNHRFKDRTSRVTDPNNPHYHINGKDYFDDNYTKPKPLKPYIADGHLLQTKDIPGAYPGWVPQQNYERTEVRNTNYIQDIEGTQADSIKHGITTKRQSNPLTPVYQSLDPGEVLQPLIPPLIPPDMVKVPTVMVGKRNKQSSHEKSDDLAKMTAVSYTDKASELDPVSFMNNSSGAGPEGETYGQLKPPIGAKKDGHTFNLDLSATTPGGSNTSASVSGRNISARSPKYNSLNDANTNTYGVASASTYNTGRLATAAANDINYRSSRSNSGRSESRQESQDSKSSGGAVASFAKSANFTSSPRDGTSSHSSCRSVAMSPAERRAFQELQNEVNAVRQL